jgi:hypothetical protein
VRGDRAAIGQREAAGQLALALDLHAHRLEGDQRGVEGDRHRERIVQHDHATLLGRAEGEAVQGEVEDEAGDAPVRAAPQALGEPRLGEDHPPGDVQGDQLGREPGLEHLRRGLRIDEEVELGGGRDVARHRDGAPHHHDAAGSREPARVERHRGGQVRERPQRDHGQVGPQPIHRLQNHFGRGSRLNHGSRLGVARPAIRLDEAVEVAEPVLAVDVTGGDQRPLERGLGSADHRGHGLGRAHREDAAGVGEGQVHRDVAGDHGHRLDAGLG